MTDLTPLRCPFCGSEPEWLHCAEGSIPSFTNGVKHVWQWQSYLHCTVCGVAHCSGFGHVKWAGGNALAHQYAMTQALRKWNRRVFVPPTDLTKPRAPEESPSNEESK